MSDLIPPNLARSALAAGLTTGGTSLTVTTGEGSKFSSPTGGDVGRLILKRVSDGAVEFVTFSGRSGDSITGLTRAVESPGNVALAFSTGDTIVEVWTHQGIINFINAHIGFGVRAYHNADQNVLTATETALALNSERHDDQGEHDTATNNSRLTAVGAGMRVIAGTVTFDTPILAGTVRRLSVRLNGTTVIARQEDFGVLNSGQTTVTVSGTYYLANGDYVELMAYQDSGGTIAVKALGNYSPEFGMMMAGGSGSLGDHDHTSTANDGGTLTNDTHDGYSDYAEISTPSTPSANHGRLYGKDVGGVTKPHWVDDGGTETQLGAASAAPAYIHLREQQSDTTNGGTFTSGAWRTRVLNTEVSDTGGNCSLSSNQFTLDAGTYDIFASAPAAFVAAHQAKLRNITDSADTIIGTSEYASASETDLITTRSLVLGRFTIASAKAFEIQHRCGVTRATTGFGVAVSAGVGEVYTEVTLYKVA